MKTGEEPVSNSAAGPGLGYSTRSMYCASRVGLRLDSRDTRYYHMSRMEAFPQGLAGLFLTGLPDLRRVLVCSTPAG